MLRTHFAKDLEPGPATVAGWVYEKRALGGILFVVLRDFTGLIQITAKKGREDEKIIQLLDGLRRESVVVVEGNAVENKQAPRGI